MTDARKRRVMAEIVAELERIYPDSSCALEYGGEPWRLMVMARLSAQCTDARVNEVCRVLFERFPTLDSLADAPLAEIADIVRPCGLWQKKSENIKEECRMVRDTFGSVVPDNMDDLLKLPGVGRKTANLLMGDLYGIPGSIVCDTHCIRICGRLGLSLGKEPEKVERQLRKILPPEKSSDFCHRIVLFGRDICTARSPKCGECPLSMYCREFNP